MNCPGPLLQEQKREMVFAVWASTKEGLRRIRGEILIIESEVRLQSSKKQRGHVQ